MKSNKSNLFFLIASVIIIIDQATKLAIKGFSIFGINHEGMLIGQSFSVIGEFLKITFVENAGMAFGISFGAGKIFLSIFSIIASIALGWYLYKLRNYNIWIKIGIMLIFAGAIGNLIDRVFYGIFYNESPLFYGRVVDFIQVDIPDINLFGLHYTHWPVFNVADSCVTIGVVLLIIFNKKIPAFRELLGVQKNVMNKNLDSSTELLDTNQEGRQ
jgi:signal peptidase II